jgi:hypothetical protein
MTDYQFFLESQELEFPCRFPAKPSIPAARPSQVYDSARFFPRARPGKKFYPEFTRAAGKTLPGDGTTFNLILPTAVAVE